MKKKISYGMVGGGPDGFIGSAHRKAISLNCNIELAAGVFSRTREKSLIIGKKYFIEEERCYQDYSEMAMQESKRKDGIDFVVVVTPNESHYEICKAFLEVGIHVVCDKPVTIYSWQAKELELLAEEKRLLFMVTYTYTGHVSAKFIRDMILSGEIGNIRMIMAEYPQGWLAFSNDDGGKQGAWRCNPKLSGDVNCLGDLGTHVENIISYMTGLKIRRVLAKMDVIVQGRVLDDNDMILVEYDNQASGFYWTSQIAIGHDNSLRVRIYGDQGSIEWIQEESEKIWITDKDSCKKEFHRGHKCVSSKEGEYTRLPAGHTEGWLEAMGNLYQNYIDCIIKMKEGQSLVNSIDFPSIRDGVEGIRFVEACLESNRNGNVWIEM